MKKDTSIKWKCRNCGFVYEGLEGLTKCPRLPALTKLLRSLGRKLLTVCKPGGGEKMTNVDEVYFC